MISHTNKEFRRLFRALPDDVQRSARKNYKLWRSDPYHGSLQFKRVNSVQPIYSVRVSLGWRACGVRDGETIIWFWIGPHAEYDRIVKKA